ncbi:globin family protein [Tuwongella immobilis]|uniref:Uncharacterized protein n=1 Tax=Tuwongella immobilis TaxID=692036 RepID=A0A6C2YJ89_9BACT|nr:hypothetical protein [Tuwongella immobilis]VIP01434.1 phycobilisome protein : Putative phycobilisome protein OS=Synechococcus sp. (strain JA-3-3Ab) GN=CYA_0523 PE=3 SV=1: Phycobilisome [Tuwongella immobilis]VTR98394.1 phycobilisome protein : Putative phycobilisome protein OS=Synechococcus sp. (strain JA-3-3Ab) GN=CYA_0523 PE=3 SV=1: Phycobilisome [Tuwongella immobilis]
MLTNLMVRLDQRYPTPGEKSAVADYVASFADRLAAYDEMRTKQKEIVDDILEEYQVMYPRFKQYHPQGWEKGRRDLELYHTFSANAMLMDDKRWLDEACLFWVCTMMKAAHLTPQFMQDACRLWDKYLQQHLTPQTYELNRPYFDHIASRLCNIPEPHKAEVGERRSGAAAPRVPAGVR